MRSLTVKLTLAFLIVSLFGVALVAVLVWGINLLEFKRFVIDRGMNEYSSAVSSYYQENQSWEGVVEYLRERGLVGGGTPVEEGDVNPPPPPFLLVDPQGVVLAGGNPNNPPRQVDLASSQQSTAVTENGEVVGYVVLTTRQRSDPFESRYLRRMGLAYLLAALGAVALAVLLGLLLARTITRPVRELTAATQQLARGVLDQPVPVRSRDELGQLTRAFNVMSAELQHANQLRKQMTADIAHDLRTPLAVITGYLEGLKDGVVKPSQQRFAAMYDEAQYLQRLVEDLRTLSLADAGELVMTLQRAAPGDLLARLVEMYQPAAEQKQVKLRVEIAAALPEVEMDPERMLQVLCNLVDNALRYTPAGGEVSLSARRAGGEVLLEVGDSGAGISAAALPHVFDRFYRGDPSRQDGGSGLGLAIARSVAGLQGASIRAESAGEGLGSRFTIAIKIRPAAS